ncbi:MAG: hypothetical protein KGL39_37295 [Patescibacteria group bacterium]|nr:hypothetical protein [Patescibacteria group bacterium]
MFSVAVKNELTAEASFTPNDPYTDLARLSFPTRKELMEAARVLNPGAIFSTIVTQHSTVVTSAQSRFAVNVR